MITSYMSVSDMRDIMRICKMTEHISLVDRNITNKLRKGKGNQSVTNSAYQNVNRVNKSRGCKGRHC